MIASLRQEPDCGFLFCGSGWRPRSDSLWAGRSGYRDLSAPVQTGSSGPPSLLCCGYTVFFRGCTAVNHQSQQKLLLFIDFVYFTIRFGQLGILVIHTMYEILDRTLPHDFDACNIQSYINKSYICYICILPPNKVHFIKLHNFNLNVLKTLLILTRTEIVYMQFSKVTERAPWRWYIWCRNM